MENVSENLGVMASPPPQPQLDLLVGEQLPSEFFKVEGESLVPKKTAQQRGQKRKLANSRSATPGTINGDEVGGVGVDASRRSSETPVSHRYAVTQPDEDARLKSIAKMGTKVLGSGDGGERGEECFTWTDLPMNRLGFRYIACANGPKSSASSHPGVFPFFRRVPQPSIHTVDYIAEASSSRLYLEAGSSEPKHTHHLGREIGGVHIDWQDRSPFLRISPSALTCTAEKGFRSGRANVGVREGTWYFECIILKGGGEGGTGPAVSNRGQPVDFGETSGSNGSSLLSKGMGSGDGSHVRLGWARREASINGPCGLDAYSYGIRDSSGEKITRSRPAPYGVPFGSGDVIGCLIHLPPVDEYSSIADVEEREWKRREAMEAKDDKLNPARISRKRFPLYYKGQHYFEMVEYPVAKEMESLCARDGRVLEPAIKPGTDVNEGIAVPLKDTTRTGSPVKKTKSKNSSGPMTKNAEGGKLGKAIKKRRNKNGKDDEDEDEESKDRQKVLPTLKGSKITFFLNGKPMTANNRPAFEDIFHFVPLRQTEKEAKARQAFESGTTADALMKQKENPYDDGTLGYYPFVSCFGGAKVKFNPGPVWERPVAEQDWNLGTKGPDSSEFIVPRPINERWPEFRVEERIFDDLDDEADMIKLKKFDAEKRKEKRAKGSSNPISVRGGKRTRGVATKRGGKAGTSMLATEIMDHSAVSSESSPTREAGGEGFEAGSRGSTPADYAMDVDMSGNGAFGLASGLGYGTGIPSGLAYEMAGRDRSSPPEEGR